MNPTEQAIAIIQNQKPVTPPKASAVVENAIAERYKAEVFARREQAVRVPRDYMAYRDRLLAHCKRHGFASQAQYRKPVGAGKTVDGPSIRFVEAALQAYGNVDISQQIIQDDASHRTIRVCVTDLETNVQISEDVQVAKTIERRQPRQGDEVISERTNSTGQVVYLVAATDDELQIKIAAAASKKIRTCGLRLLPPDVVDEAIERCNATLRSNVEQDPHGQAKAMVDAFSAIGVSAERLAEYLGHSALECTPAEAVDLRAIYSAIKDGETSWQAVVNAKAGAEASDWEKARSGLGEKLAKKKEQGQ